MGCSLATSLVDRIKKLKRTHDPDFLFVEPSEMVVTAEMRDVAAMGRRDARYDIGPLITLVDAPRFDFMWVERHQLMLGQINGADVVALSRADRAQNPSPGDIRQILAPYTKEPLLLSVHDPGSMKQLVENVPEFSAP